MSSKRNLPARAASEDSEPLMELNKKLNKDNTKPAEKKEINSVQDKSRMLVTSFIAMVVIGLGNKIFQKLQTIPMHNYPFFLTLLSTFMYIPLSFMYIIPMQKYGTSITKECTSIPKWKFAVMGSLDSIGGVMSVFAVNYITNSSMIILLTQASIPISMAMSKMLLKAHYSRFQYFGAVVVVIGIAVVLIPSMMTSNGTGGNDQLVWALVLVVSCVPQVLSSVYKEKALGETDVDVVYMNGWIAIYQFAVCLPLAIPSAYASNLTIAELPENIINGAKCYVGINSVLVSGGSSPIDDCSTSTVFVSIYLTFNLIYNVLIIMILKYGSANILWLAMTIMVPLGNVAFSLDFVPGHQPLKVTDILGLVVIMTGLVLYRFADKFVMKYVLKRRAVSFLIDEDDKAGPHAARYVGVNAQEVMLGPLIDTYRSTHQDYLRKSPLQIRTSYLSRLGFTPSPPRPTLPTISKSKYSRVEFKDRKVRTPPQVRPGYDTFEHPKKKKRISK